jgi:NADPH-dependent 2,4-dienoyl-CoA reductase/sulfur reductase-like enzyme/rhodanese-related sulfurtransferase
MKKVVIIGGMAGGCKTAARLRRLDPTAEITIVERLPFVSFGACGMPFFVRGDVDDFNQLMSTAWGTVRSPEYFLEAKKINVLTETICTRIIPEQNKIEVQDKSGNRKVLDYDYLVIATGSKPAIPKFSFPRSERISFFHSPLDALKLRKFAEQGKISDAIIIGGGFIGCELAEALSSLWGIDVVVLEKEKHLVPRSFDPEISYLLEKVMEENGIKIYTGANVQKIEEREQKCVVHFNENALETDFVFFVTGIEPEVELARNANIQIGERGGIVVNSRLQTNFPNIYAAGDCIETLNLVSGQPEVFALGSLANRQGRVIANNIAGLNDEFNGAVGSISLKVFDVIFSSVGLNTACAKRYGIEPAFALATFYDRPHYYPEHQVLFAKVLYQRENKRLLGLQLCGKGEVSRYIDSFSVLLKDASTYLDLLDFEHSYTPPHSSPLNPLNYLGGIIQNQEMFGIECVSPLKISKAEYFCVDLRKKEEIAQMPFEFESINVDYDYFWKEMSKIPRDKKILCVCQKGPRALEVAIYLKQNGWEDVSYLGGGLQMLNSSF